MFASFRDDNQFFRARGFVRQAERDDTAFANSFGARREFLDFVRIQIAPALDDDVLHAAGNVNFTVGAIRTVAGVHPRVFPPAGCLAQGQQRFRCFGIAVVAARCRRPPEPQKAFGAVFIHDAHFMPWQRFSGGNKRDGGVVRGRRGHRASLRRECLALHAIDQRAAIQWRDGDPQSGFRQAVDGELCFAAKAVTSKAVCKTLERFRIHRLRAIQRRAPAAEIHTLDIFIRDLAHAEFISKIRSRCDRSTMFVKGL